MIYVEWLKLKHYRPFWVIAASYPLALLASVLAGMKLEGVVLKEVTEKGGMSAAVAMGRSPFVFPEVWQTLTYLASWFHFLPALLVMLAVTNEFQFRTHRQNLLDGWSRARFFAAKLALVVLICAGATFLVGAVAAGVGFARGSFEGGRLHYLGVFFVQSLLYGFFSLLLAFWLKRGLLSLFAFLMYTQVAENFLSWIVGKYALTLSYLAPLGCVDHLIPFPIKQQAAEKLAAKLHPGMPPESVLLSAAALWMVVFLGLSWRLFKGQDL